MDTLVDQPKDEDLTERDRKMAGRDHKISGRNDEELAAEQTLAAPDSYQEIHAKQDEAVEHSTKIERSDLRPRALPPGGTEIVLQRHGKYVREREHAHVGSIEDPRAEREAAAQYFEDLLAQIPEDERDSVEVIFVASDTQYFDGGRRSYETATVAQHAALGVFETHGIPASNILNFTGRFHTSRHAQDRMPSTMGPKTTPALREPNFLNESPEYLDFLLEKYGGINLEFWKAFEEDKHKAEREAMGAEGPDDIADRTARTLYVLSRYAQMYHRENPGKRLIIWAGTHYDTISPFVKRDVFEVGKEAQLLVDYGAGITVDIGPDGQATTEVGDREYAVPLRSPRSRARSDEPQPPEQS